MVFNTISSQKYAASFLISLFSVTFILVSCDTGGNDENGDDLTGNSDSYELQSTADSGVSGVAVFEEMTDGSTLITLELNGTDSGAEHPAHIHANAVIEGGGIDVHLTSVDGSSGRSETVVSSLEDGTSISYEDLIAYDGHIMVHLSEDDLGTVLSRGDIGGNALTGESTEYELHEAIDSGISGSVRFEERSNGNTLATIEVTGTSEENDYPAHIHYNSVADGGGVAVPFNNVDGSTGISITNIRAEDTGENLTYSELLAFDGHVNVHLPDGTVIAEGDIGANYGQDSGNENDNNDDNGNGNDDDDDDGNGNGDDDGY